MAPPLLELSFGGEAEPTLLEGDGNGPAEFPPVPGAPPLSPGLPNGGGTGPETTKVSTHLFVGML